MPTKRNAAKTNWPASGDLRRPNSNWRVGNAARYLATLLDLPAAAVVFVRPDRTNARRDKTLGKLREEWVRHAARL